MKEGTGQAQANSTAETVNQAVASKLGTLTTSRNRIGGGGFGISFNALTAIGNRTNALLDKVEKNTRNPPSGSEVPVLS